jgi:pyoverdine/dityrosine biosynthesis protein Dit1
MSTSSLTLCPAIADDQDEDRDWAVIVGEEVLRRVFRHRRLRDTMGLCSARPCAACLEPHLAQVVRFVRAGLPVHFILPAFPVKSPSRRKTIGRLPDLAEELSLGFLQRICDEVAVVYAPGATMTICSDGRIFSDIVGVTDDDVTRYGAEIGAMIDRLGATSLSLFNLEDVFTTLDFDAMRDDVVARYGEPVEVVRERTRSEEAHLSLFRGISRFLLEDRLGQDLGKSKNRLTKEAAADAYRMIQRSNAWGALIAEIFPDAVRLSIHPQEVHSAKIGILLAESSDVWLTPWHAVVLKREGSFRLVHREDAEAMGARMVERGGRPSHFELAA